jgi:hypothetical protein
VRLIRRTILLQNEQLVRLMDGAVQCLRLHGDCALQPHRDESHHEVRRHGSMVVAARAVREHGIGDSVAGSEAKIVLVALPAAYRRARCNTNR